MIEMSVKMSEQSESYQKEMRGIAKILPKELQRAHLRAASIIPRKIQAAVRNLKVKDTSTKLPQLDALTQTIKTITAEKPGGVLAEKGRCRVWTQNGKLVAGFVSRLDNVAALWQDGGSWPINNNQRRYLSSRLGKFGIENDGLIPLVAKQPERQVIEPIAKAAHKEMPRWVLSALNKTIDQKLKRIAKK